LTLTTELRQDRLVASCVLIGPLLLACVEQTRDALLLPISAERQRTGRLN
jgi:sterol desaturase/sphingolipid hydroxylase (fatty acid hydroxylase superfamily)